MNRILILLAGLLVVGNVYALPPCPKGVFHNCFGTMTWANGDKYVGEWKEDKRHGQGTYTWASGSKYVGEYKDDKRHGQGTYTWGKGKWEGDKYVGEFKDDKMRGQGTYTHADGAKYVGEYKDDKRHGQGTFTWADGRKYVGEFKDNKQWEGILYFASGEIKRTFSNGKKCDGCKPTARQLAIVGEIDPSQISDAAVPQLKPTPLLTQVTNAEKAVNLEKCLDGVPIYCDHSLLTDQQAMQVTNAEKAVNLKTEPKSEAEPKKHVSAEVVFWQSIKDSNELAMFRAYLTKYPEGEFVLLAKIYIKNLSDTAVANVAIPNLDYGNYHALVIGNDQYQYLDNLKTPGHDAKLIAATLKRDYGFDVNLISNATRADMFAALEHYRRTSTSQDNLLIYYAGHGYLDQEADEGFWLPVDADEDSQLNWVPNADIIRSVSSMRAKHVMVVADSCFSGTLIRALAIKQKTPDYLSRIAKKKTRVAMTSGSEEPVTDVGGGGNSAFAKAFLTLLNENTGVIDGHSMFTQLRRRVMINTKQTPQYGDMRGHEDGDFLFVRQ